MSNIIHAVKIKFPFLFTERPDIGLYNDSTDTYSELRVTESPLSLVSETWAENILVEIGDREESADFSRGGAVTHVNSISIVLENTYQMSLRLNEIGAYLHGCIVEIYEFIGNDAESGSISSDVIFTGTVSSFNWTETELQIEAESSLSLRRNKALGARYNDKTIPVTFGETDIQTRRLFKAVETENLSDKIRVEDISAIPNPTEADAYPPKMSLFPVYQKTDVLTYKVRIGEFSSDAFPADRASYFVGKYALCKEGDSKNVGQYRKITACTRGGIGGPNAWILVTFDNYWPVDLVGSWSADEDADQAWLEFYEASHIYKFDTGKCKGFFDQNDNEITQGVLVYAKDGDDVVLLPPYGVDADSTETDKNTLEIKPLHYENSLENVSSYLILPVANFKEATNNLAGYKKVNAYWETNNEVSDGIYIPAVTTYTFDVSKTGDLDNVVDQDHTTYIEYDVTSLYAGTASFWHCFLFNLPEIPEGFNYDDLYLCVNVEIESVVGDFGLPMFGILQRGFINRASEVYYESVLFSGITETPQSIIDNVPDFYYTSSKDDKNINFYKENLGLVDGQWKITGRLKFNLNLGDEENKKISYENIEECMMFIEANNVAQNDNYKLKIIEVAVMLKNSETIKNVVYPIVKGRVFNDTWGSRKTATDLISNPVDLLEYVKRAQDWSENSDTALIKTSGEGSFDDSSLDDTKNLSIAWQILEYEKAFSNEMAQEICETFYMCSYQDNNGNECVKTITEGETPTDNIDMFSVIPDSIGQLQEPEPRDIFVEPYINYAYDYATEKYLSQLAIRNVTTQASWDIDCTPGFVDDEGEALWYICRNLWLKYRHYEKLSQSMTDLQLVPDYETAKWIITQRINWMGKKRLTFSVFYEGAKDWKPSRHININFPHHTNGYTIECIVEKLRFSKSKNRVDLTVILIDEIPNSFYSTTKQETPGAETAWQETPGAETVYQERRN